MWIYREIKFVFCGVPLSCSFTLATCMVLLLGMHLYRIAFDSPCIWQEYSHSGNVELQPWTKRICICCRSGQESDGGSNLLLSTYEISNYWTLHKQMKVLEVGFSWHLTVPLRIFHFQVTHYLGGENYVFWGGREGYQSLLNTDMERELDHMVRLP